LKKHGGQMKEERRTGIVGLRQGGGKAGSRWKRDRGHSEETTWTGGRETKDRQRAGSGQMKSQ
jgi:hypothetical protein